MALASRATNDELGDSMINLAEHIDPSYQAIVDKQTKHILPHWILEHLDITITHLAAGSASFRIADNPALFRHFPQENATSHLSGQAIMAIADTLLIFPVLAQIGLEQEMATLHCATEFLRPVVAGTIRVEAYVLKFGRTAIRGRVDLYDQHDKLCASSTICYAFVQHHT